MSVLQAVAVMTVFPYRPSGEALSNTPDTAAAVGLRSIVDILLRQWVVIGGTVVAILAVAVLVAVQLTPRFTASTQLLVAPREERLVNIDEVASGLPINSATVDSEVEVIKSDRVAIEVIRDLSLLERKDFIPEPSLLDGLRSLFGVAPAPGSGAADANRTLSKALETFHENLSVRRRGVTYVIEVTFTSQDPEDAAAIANAVAETYLRQNIEAKLDVNQRAAELLRERLSALSDQLRDSETALDDFMRRQVDLALLEGSTEALEQAVRRWQDLRNDSAETSQIYEKVEAMVAAGDYAQAARMLGTKEISEIVALQEDLQKQESEVRLNAAEPGRGLFDLQNELRRVNTELREQVVSEASNLRLRTRIIEDRLETARQAVREEAAQNRGTSGVALELWKLQQDAEANRVLYETFLSRLRQTEQLQSAQLTTSRVISPALPPLNPSYPRMTLILALSTLFGVGLGVGAGFARELFAEVARDEAQLEQALGVPVVASIPLISNGTRGPAGREDRWLVDSIVEQPLGPFAEAIRRARIGVELALESQPASGAKNGIAVMVASSLSGEGKSTVSVLLARSWAQDGRKVALVDLDLRRPTIDMLLDDPARPAAPAVEAAAPDKSGTARTLFPTLLDDPLSPAKYLPAGGYPADWDTRRGFPKEGIRRMIGELKRRFDIVVVDVPPLLPIVDARLVLSAVDATAFVVRANSTTFPKMRRGLRDLLHERKPIVSVLNGVTSSRSSYYAYQGYYGAQSRSYFDDDELEDA